MRLSLAAVRGNRHFLEQGLDLLRRVPPEAYGRPVRAGWAPVGAQFRHILDHYRAFAEGWSSGRIDYDLRQRSQLVEVDPTVAMVQASQMIEALEQIHVEDANRPLVVQMDSGGDQGLPDWRPSTIGRELQFLVSHTVHHFALIKLLLEDAGVPVDPDFGMAPSTLAHRTREQAGKASVTAGG